MPTTADTFARGIDGAFGTVVFGNGLPAVEGEIAFTGGDYVWVNTPAPKGDTLIVPLASIAYFRFDND